MIVKGSIGKSLGGSFGDVKKNKGTRDGPGNEWKVVLYS